MLRYRLIGLDLEIAIAYDLTHGARVVTELFTAADGRIYAGQLVSTEAEIALLQSSSFRGCLG